MRKGERSRFIRRLARGNVSHKEGDGIRRALIVDLCGEKGSVRGKPALNSTIVCESECENLAVEDENNGGTRRKETKGEAGSSSNLSVGVRVLRAFSRMRDGERSNIKEKGGVLTGKRKEFDVFEIERDNEEAAKANNGARELKRKGRRPRIIDLSAQDEALAEIHGVDRNEIDGMHSSRPMIWLKQIEELFVELHGPNYIHKATTSPLRSHTVDAGEIRTKQFARKLILKQLLGAGWTVDRKSRDGSEYEHDVLYVSPQGQTHRSIKLAYHKLQRHYEAHHGFKFAPVPQMILNVLTDQEVGSSGGLGNPYLTSSYEMPVQMRDKKKNRKRNKKQCVAVAYYGKRTVLSWMIDLGTIQIDEPVYYVDHRCKCVLMDGMISRGGIHCGCCNEIISISEFEAHSRRYMSHSFFDDPLTNICIEGGASLLHCMLKSWNKQHISKRPSFHFVDLEEDSHDDTCIACGDGGDVIICDSCPSIFHRSCSDIQEVPSGEWHCMYCCCKFCGLLDPYTNQIGSTRTSTSTSTSHSIEPSLFTCCFCERKYHKSCLEANRGMIVHSSDAIYCGNICQQLCERLERLLGVKHEMEDGFSSTFICRSNVDSHMEPHMIECNSKLAVALLLMDECFAPHIDQRTGINVIHSVLYNIGSNFERLNNERFVTAILEKDDEIICAASIRIHGNQLAEMPYIATRYAYRRQGMCHRFLNAVESALRSLNVVLLVIPALSEVKKTWISAFGFEPLTSRTKQIIRSLNLLRFPGAEMLQKRISTHDFNF